MFNEAGGNELEGALSIEDQVFDVFQSVHQHRIEKEEALTKLRKHTEQFRSESFEAIRPILREQVHSISDVMHFKPGIRGAKALHRYMQEYVVKSIYLEAYDEERLHDKNSKIMALIGNRAVSLASREDGSPIMLSIEGNSDDKKIELVKTQPTIKGTVAKVNSSEAILTLVDHDLSFRSGEPINVFLMRGSNNLSLPLYPVISIETTNE